MFAESREFGKHRGLGIFDGVVDRLQVSSPLKVPQVGWNRLLMPNTVTWDGTVLERVQHAAFMYFMHSYCVTTTDRSLVLAETAYGEEVFCSAVRRNRITGVQFHPELSGPNGLSIYAQFRSMINVDLPIHAVTHKE
jgi:glutamine amidotransferase